MPASARGCAACASSGEKILSPGLSPTALHATHLFVKPRNSSLLTTAAVPLLLLAAVVSFAFMLSAGCSGIERAAQDVQYMTGGGATTQPSAALQAGRVAVELASGAHPAVAGVVSVIALLSGAVAGVAGHFNGKRKATKQYTPVLEEVLSDIERFRDPHTPWTDATRKLLETLGYGQAAAVEPKPQPADDRQDLQELVSRLVREQQNRVIL